MSKIAKITIEFEDDPELSQTFDNVVEFNLEITPEFLQLGFAGNYRTYEKTGRQFIAIHATTDKKVR